MSMPSDAHGTTVRVFNDAAQEILEAAAEVVRQRFASGDLATLDAKIDVLARHGVKAK